MRTLTTEQISNLLYNLECKDYEKLTVNGSVTTLTGSKVTSATNGYAHMVMMSIENDSVRMTLDGSTAPASGVGHVIAADDGIDIFGHANLENIKFLNVSGSVDIQVSYFYEKS